MQKEWIHFRKKYIKKLEKHGSKIGGGRLGSELISQKSDIRHTQDPLYLTDTFSLHVEVIICHGVQENYHRSDAGDGTNCLEKT